MNAAKLARAITFVVTTLYTLVLLLTHSSLPSPAAKLVPYVPTVVGFGLLLFDLWAWRFPLIHQLVARPLLRGTWIGELQPAEESHIPTGGDKGPILIALVIEQTYWSIGVTLMTAQSTSQSTASSIRSDAESPGRRILAYTYVNTPDQKHQNRSHPHFGAAELRVVGRLPSKMSGQYWTARFTAGDMTVKRVNGETDYASLDAVIAAVKATR